MAATSKTVRGKPAPQARESGLTEFVWKATDKRGVVMKGESSAKSANFVKAELRKQGLNPQEVKPKPKPLFGAAGKTVSAAEVTLFSRQIATMMQSGVPMVQAMEILAQGQKNVRFRDMITDLRNEIAGGIAFSESLKKYPVQFNELYRNLVKAGEGAGVLDTVLDNLATYLERIQVIKGKIIKAMFYPAAVIAVGIIVSLVLLMFVIPQFKSTFASFGAELPAFTMFYITLSEFVTSNWWWMLLASIGGVIGLHQGYIRSEAVQDWVDRTLLKLPVLGDILHKSAVSRFARTLALTFKAGVPLVEALETVSGATGSRIYDRAVKRIQGDVAVGFPLNMSMKQVNLFPHIVVQMTAIGEEAGALDTMLFKVADFYEQEVDNAVDAMTSLLEPFIIVILGTMVGSMVIAMYLPIFKLGETI
jgi:type IV pilus assembly protein PilC